jgi:hypothetical protein
MKQSIYPILWATVLAPVALLLLLIVFLALLAYTAFMVIWVHVPAVQVLAFTGPVAVLTLLLAAAVIRGAWRRRTGQDR